MSVEAAGDEERTESYHPFCYWSRSVGSSIVQFDVGRKTLPGVVVIPGIGPSPRSSERLLCCTYSTGWVVKEAGMGPIAKTTFLVRRSCLIPYGTDVSLYSGAFLPCFLGGYGRRRRGVSAPNHLLHTEHKYDRQNIF